MNSWLEEFNIQSGRRDSVLVGNKTDLEERRQVSTKTVQSWCAKQNAVGEAGEMKYFEASAKTNTRVADAFQAIAVAALAKKTLIEGTVAAPQMVSLNNSQPATNASASGVGSCAC